MTDTTTQPRRSAWQTALLIWIGIALTYVFLIPVGNNLLLYPILLSLVAIAAVHWLRHPTKPDRSFLWPAAFWVAFLLVGVVSAVAQSAESWTRTLVFFLVWPAAYAVIVAGFDRRVVKLIFRIGAVVSIVIGLLFYLEGIAATWRLTILPSFITTPLNLRHVTDDSGMVAMTATILPPLIWWGGMWVASLFVDRADAYLPPLWLRWVAASLTIAGAFISWRRAVVVVIILTPIIALTGILVLKIRNAKTSSPRVSWRGIGIAVAAFVVALGLTLTVQPSVGEMFSHLVGSSKAAVAEPDATLTQDDIEQQEEKPRTVAGDDQLSDKIRANESQSLTKTEGPVQLLIGHGFGASFDRGGIDRTIRPWQTELQYHAIYYWTGVLGLLLLFATAVSGLGVVRKAFRIDDNLRGVLFVASVGSVAVLLANATNPYLQAPGHMWPLFFPLMIASAIFTARRRSEVASPQLADAAR